jgi:hypothetical protein
MGSVVVGIVTGLPSVVAVGVMLWLGSLATILVKSGPRVHDQPEGSFWIREKDARGMLASNGSWVFSDVDGFPARDLPDYGTSSYL